MGLDRTDRTLSHLNARLSAALAVATRHTRVSHSASPLGVSAEIAATAARWATSATVAYRTVIRARIVRDAIAGLSNEENARRNGTHPDTVRKTRRRAENAASAAEAFADAARSGRPPRIALETRTELIKIACSRPTPELAKERVAARVSEARQAQKRSKKALRRAKAKQRRALRRNDAQAAEARRVAAKAVRKAARNARMADAALLVARADHARAGKERRGSFSTVWTHRTLQVELVLQTGKTMSLSEIRRTLWCGGLRPHRVRMWLHSPDPDFHAKTKVICDLYLNPPPNAVVLSVDEKTGMQAKSHLHEMHVGESRDVRREFEYERHGTSTLIASFDIRTGEVFGRLWRRTATGFVRFLDELAKRHPDGDVYVICDNLNVHKGALIDEFIERHGGRFHFVYTPLHASWLNQVEIWFSILQRRVLRHGSFGSKSDLEAAVSAFIRHWNSVERRPFRWTFRGDFAPRLPWAA